VPATDSSKMESMEASLLKERYIIERELGRGGMGIVYLARDAQLHARSVVIKILYEEAYRDEFLKRKFLQEMEALTRLDHSGIVSVYDAGELPDGRPYFVMQYIDGCNLRSLIVPEGMQLERIALLIRQIGSALQAAHNNGILHRDLKPENIMIRKQPDGEEQLKLIDFGLAKVIESKVAETSRVGNVIGSFEYMSPEQLTAKSVDPTSDIYSLGVIAYEMVTGRKPFEMDNVFDLYNAQRAGPKEPKVFRNDLSPEAERCILKALSLDPNQRPQSARDFTEEFVAALLDKTALKSAADQKPRTPGLPQITASVFIPILIILGVLWAKVSFFRFHDWKSFLLQPTIIFTAVVLFGLFVLGYRKKVLLLSWSRLLLILAALLLLTFRVLITPPVLSVKTIKGEISADPVRFNLNYSDLKGYKYTIVRSNYCTVSIDPGRWNRLSNYVLQIKLSPQIEFADVYLDNQFQIAEQLRLQASPTNDILIIEKRKDDFRRQREIRFNVKYRSFHPSNRIQVLLKAGDIEFKSDNEFIFPENPSLTSN
jgi:serine/threonine protein kinase